MFCLKINFYSSAVIQHFQIGGLGHMNTFLLIHIQPRTTAQGHGERDSMSEWGQHFDLEHI